ncbi:MAG TPA: ester cyclase [Alphaproteobacteria bacterium]|nr:ester cyclase [Alphaproteobacteria bacterium]
MTNVELIRVWYERMWNRWHKSVFPDILTADITFRGSLGNVIAGPQGVGAYMDIVQKAFPDFCNHVEEIITEGNKSFARLCYTGTHRGTIFGIEATDNRIEYMGAAVFTFRDGRISNVWVLGDVHGLIQQLRTEKKDMEQPHAADADKPRR